MIWHVLFHLVFCPFLVGYDGEEIYSTVQMKFCCMHMHVITISERELVNITLVEISTKQIYNGCLFFFFLRDTMVVCY